MISAVAQKYNIHPQTLRLYEREGLLKPSRTDGNTRLYSEEDLEQLETILTLDARSRRESCGRRSDPQHAAEDSADAGRGERVHGVCQARARPRHRRLGAAAQHGDGEIDVDRSRARESAVGRAGARRQKNTRDKKTSRYHVACFRRRKTNPSVPLCNGTGWKSFQDGDVERVTRCDCWRDDINKRLVSRRAHSAPLPSLHAQRLRHLRQRDARRRAEPLAQDGRASFRSSSAGCSSSAIRASARRTSPSRF